MTEPWLDQALMDSAHRSAPIKEHGCLIYNGIYSGKAVGDAYNLKYL